MASERYSFSLTTFSPSGKLVSMSTMQLISREMDILMINDAFQVQIEYALQAVASGAPSVGIKVGNDL